MSEDRFATTRALFEAWNEGNVERMEEFWTADGDWTWEDPPDLPDARVVKGKAQVQAHIRELMDLLGDLRAEVGELRAVGDAMLATLTTTVEGGQSGVAIDTAWVHVAHFDGGRVRRWQVFTSPEAALAAASE